MIQKAGLTRIEAIVAAACAVFLFINIGVIASGGRERAKKEVCLENLRALTAGWQTYAQDNSGNLVNGGQAGVTAGGGVYDWVKEPWWCTPLPPLPTSDEFGTFPAKRFDWDLTLPYGERMKLLQQGSLYKYCPDAIFFRCPQADKNMHRSYIMPGSMNAEWKGAPGNYMPTGRVAKNTGQIARPNERIVFLEERITIPDAFQFPTPIGGTFPQWLFDKPSVMHGDGINFGFADGHANYRKWECAAVLKWARDTDNNDAPTIADLNACPEDYNWLLNGIWGIKR